MKIKDVTCTTKSIKTRLFEFFKTSPNDEVYTTTELSKKFEVSSSAIRMQKDKFPMHFLEVIRSGGACTFWGSLTAMKNFKNKLNNQ